MHRNAIPQTWSPRRLLDLVQLPHGQVDPRNDPYPTWPLIAPDHVGPGTGRLLQSHTAEEQHVISGKYVAQPSDVVLSKIRPALRKVIHVDSYALCSADMYPLRPGPEMDSRFLFWILLSEKFTTFAVSRAGRSGIPKINRSELREYMFPLPPLNEQRRIAEILDGADECIHWTIESIEKAKLTQAAVWGDLGVRSGAVDVQLGRLLKNSPQNGYSPVEADGYTGIFVLGLSCLTAGGFAPLQLKPVSPGDPAYKKAVLNDGDLLISRSNTRDLVGMSGRYRDVGALCIYPDLMMRLRPVEEVRPQYLELCLRSVPLRQQIQAVAQGTSGSMVKISASSVRNLNVPLPALDGQDRMLQAMRPWTDAQLNAEHSLNKLLLVKQGLMDDLLSGKVRVSEFSG